MSPGIETVLQVLASVGFERLPKPLMVSGATFEFEAAARGTGVSHDLVVVATSPNADRRLVRLLSGLNRTLDQVGSKRPVSLVLLGKPVHRANVAELAQHTRVLTIESEDPTAQQVARAVAVLMPLRLPSAETRGREPLAEVAEILGPRLSEEHQRLIDAGEIGPEEVRDALRRYITAAVSGMSDERGGQ